ncbi:MAG: hypothetical protein JRG94_00230 [Deltaproteobacteria bacterium]|nr:hypothetical protein [Deltaproteobacteria bacterium]
MKLVPLQDVHVCDRFGYIRLVLVELGWHDRLDAALAHEPKMLLVGRVYPVATGIYVNDLSGSCREEPHHLLKLDFGRGKILVCIPLPCGRRSFVLEHGASPRGRQHDDQQRDQTSTQLHDNCSS